MKIDPSPAGTQAWLEARAGIPSASEADQLITPTGKARDGDMVNRLLATKLAERWMGPLPGFGSWNTDQGQLLETEALPCFTFEYGVPIERVGFITDDAGKCGCSPDALLYDGTIGLEVKSLQPVHHCACLINGGLPKDFFAQIHFSMHVTGFYEWKLFLYSRHLPKMLLTVKRDEEIQSKIADALHDFHVRFNHGWAKLLDLNGGEPPPRREPMVFAHEYRSEFPS